MWTKAKLSIHPCSVSNVDKPVTLWTSARLLNSLMSSDGSFSPARKNLDFGDATSFSQQELCARCRDLDLLHFLHEEIPWKSPDDIDQIASSESKYIRSLGQTGSIEFWKNCPLCRCLFALTPNPSSTTQTVLILPNWTITRLEGVVAVDTEDKRRYAKCLLVGLDPSSLSSLPFSDRTQRGDALCIV
jgi:hypothetical protein